MADRQGDLGTVYRSEGRIADALQYKQQHYQFAKMTGKWLLSICVGVKVGVGVGVGYHSQSLHPNS